MLDTIFSTVFEAAYSAFFEVGAVMAVLMLVFGLLDFKRGDQLREQIIRRKLDKPAIMVGLSLIPVDGTLLFQYTTYKRKGIRPGSLLAGMIGIGEESTYIILSYQPLTWLLIVVIKFFIATFSGFTVNMLEKSRQFSEKWQEKDITASTDEEAIEADENFHELPDKFRHKLHHMRYHKVGKYFWIMFVIALIVQIFLQIWASVFNVPIESYDAMGIPLISWMAMIGIIIVFLYRMFVRIITKEFGKIFEHEFEDSGDAVGDLAEICSGVILIIFVLSFLINLIVALAGEDRLAQFFAGRELMAVIIAALIGLIPGTGASLAFTTLYFTLAGSQGALPFASLLACSMALIGDSQIVGNKQIRYSQRRLHLISFMVALITGLIVLFIETKILG